VTSRRRLREQLYIAEAERQGWFEAWRKASENECVCRVDNAPCGTYNENNSNEGK